MPYIDIISENALKLHFDHTDINSSAACITRLRHTLLNAYPELIVDLIPAYASLTIIVDFRSITPQKFAENIDLESAHSYAKTKHINTHAEHHDLPCYYGPEVNWDGRSIADHHNISEEQVVEWHQEREYRVYALGFSPGFPYLGTVDRRITMPRRADPRTLVPRGAVGIAEQQTGIYPDASPGGWNIIGSCPIRLFDITRKNTELSTLAVGDSVRFYAIGKTEFYEFGGELPVC